MIEVSRGEEPDELRKLRIEKVPALAKLIQKRALNKGDVVGYKKPCAGPLWRAQRHKCCYCEVVILRPHNDVEHYRPKLVARRAPGSTETHGYWWLAYTWANLLFACPSCNRSKKKDLFPLETGSVALRAKQQPPGRERPLLIDPSRENGVAHIEFVFMANAVGGRKHWFPRARRGSQKGDQTVRVVGLSDHIELYDRHVNVVVRPIADDLNEAIRDRGDVNKAFSRALRLLQPSMPYVGLSYDALCALVPNTDLARHGLSWPAPNDVGRGIDYKPERKTRGALRA